MAVAHGLGAEPAEDDAVHRPDTGAGQPGDEQLIQSLVQPAPRLIGGTLIVQSEKGAGTKITLRIPV